MEYFPLTRDLVMVVINVPKLMINETHYFPCNIYIYYLFLIHSSNSSDFKINHGCFIDQEQYFSPNVLLHIQVVLFFNSSSITRYPD
jgi:hypothetical protein